MLYFVELSLNSITTRETFGASRYSFAGVWAPMPLNSDVHRRCCFLGISFHHDTTLGLHRRHYWRSRYWIHDSLLRQARDWITIGGEDEYKELGRT